MDEFKYFFELFNDINFPKLKGDITSFKYFLLCLKTNERDIYKFVENTRKDMINGQRVQLYSKFLKTLN